MAFKKLTKLKEKFNHFTNNTSSLTKGAISGAVVGGVAVVALGAPVIATPVVCAAVGAWAWRKARGF